MSPAKQRPWITIVVATYNSARFLPAIATMLERQQHPAGETEIEVLAVDGGSIDGTRELARSLGFDVLDNPAGNAIVAKNIGLQHASARLVCILDHDEILIRDDSLSRRYEAFSRDSSLRAVVSAGYRFGPSESSANMYASEFGDPASMLIYRCPNNERYRLKVFESRLEVVSSDDGVHTFRAGSESKPILCEMAAGSGTVDVDYFRSQHPEVLADRNAFPHAYYFLNPDDHIAILDGDSVSHSSADSWSVVRSKVAWRVQNAVGGTSVDSSGFTGRRHTPMYSPGRHSMRFALYSILVLPPLADSIYLAISRRRIGYLQHFSLTYYVVWKAVSLRVTRMARKSVNETRYGE